MGSSVEVCKMFNMKLAILCWLFILQVVYCKNIVPKGSPSSGVSSVGFKKEWYESPAIKADTKDIHFYLFTSLFGEQEELFLTEESIADSNFNTSRDQTIFIIHGFADNSDGWVAETKELFLLTGDYNVILVDWRKHAKSPWFFSAVKNVRIVADQTSFLLNLLVKYTSLDSARVTMVGHSLGAHVAGDAGMVSRKMVNPIGRIIAMDPTGPEFHTDDIDVRLDPSDADFVVVIHTNGGILLQFCVGYYAPCGHVDLYPNGGVHQPGCIDLGNLFDLITGGYSHRRSIEYMMEGIIKPTGFMATQCDSFEDYQAGKCDGNTQTPVGVYTKPDSVTGGKFYLTTNKKTPYSMN